MARREMTAEEADDHWTEHGNLTPAEVSDLTDAQWDADRLEREIDAVDALTHRWAFALCKAAGSDPLQELGNPPRPRWLGYVYPASLVLKCRPHMEPSVLVTTARTCKCGNPSCPQAPDA